MRRRERFLLASLVVTALAALAFGMSEGGADADEPRGESRTISPLVNAARSAHRGLACEPEPRLPVLSSAGAGAELVASVDDRRRRR